MPATTPSTGPSYLARLATDPATALRVIDVVNEAYDPLEAVSSASEDRPGHWTVRIYFLNAPDEDFVRSLVAHGAGDEAARAVTFETSDDKDWVKASLEGLSPVAAGRFVVHGSHDRTRIPGNRIGIEIEAALAFGTGHHGTTRGCLLAIDALLKSGRPRGRRRVLDVGTGTGVLAIAAARALHRPILASDIDPVAVATARENARADRAGTEVTFVRTPGLGNGVFRRRGPFDLILANILMGPLKLLAKPMAGIAARGGRIVLSGLLTSHANAVLAAYRSQGFSLERRTVIDDWVTLILKRS